MRSEPQHVHMINGVTDESFTNDEILRRSVPLARALLARRASGAGGGGAVLCVMRNREPLVALYYAAMFAGVPVCLLDPLSMPHELQYFLPLVAPSLVVCDADRLGDVTAAVRQYGALSAGDVIAHDALQQFGAPHDSDPDTFQPVAVDPESCGVLLPTSGSTGLPKAAEIQYSALLAHLPTLWSHHERFPRPEERAMFMSTAQWMTFSNLLTACPVFGVTVLLSPDKAPAAVLRAIHTHKPTWLLLIPSSAAALAEAASEAQLASLRTAVLTGSAAARATLAALRRRAPGARVVNSYGMTEAQGFAALAAHDAPAPTVGRVFNIFHYKLVDENGKEVPIGERGELYLKSDCIIKRYLNNEEAYAEGAAADGWWRTGDVFTEDGDGNLFFVERKKFWFKALDNNYQISPEEIEQVISGVSGVREVVVAGSERGAAAAVVRGAGAGLARGDIHRALSEQLLHYKRLTGGIAFVTSLPRTHSGKLHRADCTRLLNQLVRSEQLLHYKRLTGGIAFVTSLPRTHSGKLHRADCTRLLNQLVRSGECHI